MNMLAWSGYGLHKRNASIFGEMPHNKGFIVASNHQSSADAFFIGMTVPRPTHFLGRQKTVYRNAFWAMVGRLSGTIPISDTPGSNRAAIDAGVQVLKKGEVLGVFPEGALIRGRKDYHGKTGAARMALLADVPIVPVGLQHTDGMMMARSEWPQPVRRVKMHVGRPWYFPTLAGETDKELVRLITDALMYDIRILSGLYGVPEDLRSPLLLRGKQARKDLAALLSTRI